MPDGLPIWFSDDKEGTLFKNLGRELIEDLINQHLTLFRVDHENTESNFYNEAKKKSYLSPIEVKARIRIADSDVISEGGIRRMSKGDMTAWVYIATMQELGIEINVGDFIKFQGKFYEIYDPGYNKDSMNRKYAADRDFYREILAKVVHENVFKSIEGES